MMNFKKFLSLKNYFIYIFLFFNLLLFLVLIYRLVHMLNIDYSNCSKCPLPYPDKFKFAYETFVLSVLLIYTSTRGYILRKTHPRWSLAFISMPFFLLLLIITFMLLII